MYIEYYMFSDLNFDPKMSQCWHEYFIISCTCAQKQYLDFRSLNFADCKPHQMVWFACDPCIRLLHRATEGPKPPSKCSLHLMLAIQDLELKKRP